MTVLRLELLLEPEGSAVCALWWLCMHFAMCHANGRLEGPLDPHACEHAACYARASWCRLDDGTTLLMEPTCVVEVAMAFSSGTPYVCVPTPPARPFVALD